MADDVLTEDQCILMMERREKALQKRKQAEEHATRVARIKHLSDTHGGFFAPHDDSDHGVRAPAQRVLVEEPPPDLASPHKICIDCSQEFYDGLLRKQFGINVCDDCRKLNENEKYTLITKTEAKEEYLLTDVDLDVNFGGLVCVEKKNPRNERWGLMKLYLRCQVEKVCFDRYGGEDGLDKEIVRRSEEKLKMQSKKQKNKVARLRKETMTSLWRKPASNHEHSFGAERESSPNVWIKTCSECGFEVEFERM
jgi:DNA-repair protein complementing XP-A cells